MPGPYQQRVTVTRAVTAKSGDRHVMRRGLTRRDEGEQGMQKGWYTIPNQRSVGEVMAATRERKAEAKEAVFEPDGTQVVEALRSLIRREMGKPTENEHPSLKEGMWLLLFCVNLVLLVSRLPRELLSDPTVELAGRLVPALLGSLFVIYLDWVREGLLAF